jgi:hypothetical protein
MEMGVQDVIDSDLMLLCQLQIGINMARRIDDYFLDVGDQKLRDKSF